eukprot:tig00000204_g17737.t1
MSFASSSAVPRAEARSRALFAFGGSDLAEAAPQRRQKSQLQRALVRFELRGATFHGPDRTEQRVWLASSPGPAGEAISDAATVKPDGKRPASRKPRSGAQQRRKKQSILPPVAFNPEGRSSSPRATASADPREAAYFAVLAWLRDEAFVQDYISSWIAQARPSAADVAMAREIASGTVRRFLSLDRILANIGGPKLDLRRKERVIFLTAIYQHVFMDRIPLYAIVNEAVKLARKYGKRQNFLSLVNAVLRKLPDEAETLLDALPQGTTADDIAVRYSYPPFLVKRLVASYGLEETQRLLEVSNLQPMVTARRMEPLADPAGVDPETRAGDEAAGVFPYRGLPELEEAMWVVEERRTGLARVVQGRDFYVQNLTPALLLARLAAGLPEPPRRVLDLCSAPGGKTLGLAQLLARRGWLDDCELWANDVAPGKLERMRENFDKYGLRVRTVMAPGELFGVPAERWPESPCTPPEGALAGWGDEAVAAAGTFDVVLVDAPCSNSGVLHKRPEARWRIAGPESVHALQGTQMALLARAAGLVRPGGQVWYTTCSVLPEENGRLAERACETLPFRMGGYSETVVPSLEGFDGGFGCLLIRDDA